MLQSAVLDPLKPLKQKTGGGISEVAGWLANGGEWRPHQLRECSIVKSGDGQLVGNVEPYPVRYGSICQQ